MERIAPKIVYENLSKEDFDAIVTGEYTHYAIWLEDELGEIVADYFLGKSSKRKDFKRLILHRDGMNFQNKIDLVRAMLPLLKGMDTKEYSSILNEIENFKFFRNSLAHGRDISDNHSVNNYRLKPVASAYG